MIIKYKSRSIVFHSQFIFSILLLIFGILAILVSFSFPGTFKEKNPNFNYVWLYSSSIILFLGIFITIYQRRNRIIFDLKQNEIRISELLGGQKHSFTIPFNKIKEFNLFYKQSIGNAHQKQKIEFYLIDNYDNSFILGEIKQKQSLFPFLEILASKFDKKINIFTSRKDYNNFTIPNIEVHHQLTSTFLEKGKVILNKNYLLTESKKNFKCNSSEKFMDKISWNFKKQSILALISTLLAAGLVLLFAMVIIPIKGYTFWISLGLFTATLYLAGSIIMLLYSLFASSTLFLGDENITFETNLFNSILFHQTISRNKLLYIEGSLDSVMRNEIVLLTKEGFRLLYNQLQSSGSPDEKTLKENILIIDTRPLLSSQRYFLQRKLYELIK